MRCGTLIAVAALAALLASAPAGNAGDRSSVVTVKIFVPRGSVGTRCDVVFPLARSVRPPAVLTGAMQALLAGPTAAERRLRPAR